MRRCRTAKGRFTKCRGRSYGEGSMISLGRARKGRKGKTRCLQWSRGRTRCMKRAKR